MEAYQGIRGESLGLGKGKKKGRNVWKKKKISSYVWKGCS
jgi:hypothetical protein